MDRQDKVFLVFAILLPVVPMLVALTGPVSGPLWDGFFGALLVVLFATAVFLVVDAARRPTGEPRPALLVTPAGSAEGTSEISGTDSPVGGEPAQVSPLPQQPAPSDVGSGTTPHVFA